LNSAFVPTPEHLRSDLIVHSHPEDSEHPCLADILQLYGRQRHAARAISLAACSHQQNVSLRVGFPVMPLCPEIRFVAIEPQVLADTPSSRESIAGFREYERDLVSPIMNIFR
jgi:hypothetical protein